jgi:predicted phage replisome organizer
MAEVKWIKILPDLFDDEKIQLIEALPEGDSIIVIWFKLLCFAGKQNNGGVFMVSDKLPYNEEMFATIFRRPLNTIRLALNTFEMFEMVEVINNTYTITNWEKHQNVDKMEEIREYNKLKQRESRAKRKLLQSVNDNVNDKSMTCQPCQDIEEEREEEKESHSFIHTREEAKLKFMGGKLGQGVVLLSNEQFDDLCDKLSIDEIDKYISIVAECELKGKSYKKKSHYQAILDMVAKDRRVNNG